MGTAETTAERPGQSGRVHAAAALALSGSYAMQGRAARDGLELWAADRGVDLTVVDDESTPARAVDVYRALLAEDAGILIGPYGSHMVRRVAPVVCGAGRLLWNHGGAADDLATPGLATVVAPASSYLERMVALARDRGLDEVVTATGPGRFARQVGEGALRAASARGMGARRVGSDEWETLLDRAGRGRPASLRHAALAFVGTFGQDLAALRRVRDSGLEVGLLGCVAAGVGQFGRHLGWRADGVVGPVQWWRRDEPAEVGPSGRDFARRFEQRYGHGPDYVAAQAAASGYLALEAHRRGDERPDVRRWRTSSLLGPFRLDGSWRQSGYVPALVEWRDGRQVLVAGSVPAS